MTCIFSAKYKFIMFDVKIDIFTYVIYNAYHIKILNYNEWHCKLDSNERLVKLLGSSTAYSVLYSVIYYCAALKLSYGISSSGQKRKKY